MKNKNILIMINSENYEIIHEQNYMEGYLVEDLEHIDLIKETYKR